MKNFYNLLTKIQNSETLVIYAGDLDKGCIHIKNDSRTKIRICLEENDRSSVAYTPILELKFDIESGTVSIYNVSIHHYIFNICETPMDTEIEKVDFPTRHGEIIKEILHSILE